MILLLLLFMFEADKRETLSYDYALIALKDTSINDILFLHELTIYAALEYLFLLLDTHIAYKDILFLHELTFHVDLVFLFALLYTHIAHKDILFLYELTFYAHLDDLFVLLDTHIPDLIPI